jgi:hypothetical protein
MKSWANPEVVVVVIVVVVEVAIRIDIPDVVIVVSRPKPNHERRQQETRNHLYNISLYYLYKINNTYLICPCGPFFPYSEIFFSKIFL